MKSDIHISIDSESPVFLAVAPGLIAAAMEMDNQLFVRAQLDPKHSDLTWPEAWEHVKERFGYDEFKSEAKIVKHDDGTELRQLFLGPA